MGEANEGGYNGTIPQILGLAGLSIKAMMTTGIPDPEARDKLGDQVLGLNIMLGLTLFSFLLKFRFIPN